MPIGAASDTITMSSNIGYTEFFQNIADTMDIRKKDLNIAYKLNCSTKDELPLVLKAPLHVVRLFSAARRELEARENGTSKVKKELKATIIDLRPKPSKEKPGKATKKPAPKVSSGVLQVSLGLIHGSPNTVRPKGIAMMMTTNLKLNEAKNRKPRSCENWRRHIVARSMIHFAWSPEMANTSNCRQQISVCGVFYLYITTYLHLCGVSDTFQVEGGHESMTKPPPALNLPIEAGTEAPARSRRPQQPQNAFPGGAYPYPFYPPPPGPYPHAYYPPAHPPYIEQRPKSPVQAARSGPKPSVSTDLDEDEPPTLFPIIEDWLLELDTSERGNDGHNFSQFGPSL